MPRELTIGRLEKETGVKVPTIRYYEKIGLMPAPIRTSGNQRRYGPAHVARLGFIRHARELGFPLERVREILTLGDRPDRSCAEVDRIARDHLAAVEARIARLTALKAPSESFQLDDRVFYLHAPDGIGRSRLAAGAEKAFGCAATSRNWRTVRALEAMLG